MPWATASSFQAYPDLGPQPGARSRRQSHLDHPFREDAIHTCVGASPPPKGEHTSPGPRPAGPAAKRMFCNEYIYTYDCLRKKHSL